MNSREELMAAVESMFRIRAVESPPDAGGVRRIWHRGRRGAELVTLVDARGRVVQQDFTLFDAMVRWDKDRGFRHSRVVQSVEGAAAEGLAALFGGDETERLAWFRNAVESYSGTDRFIQHLKEQLTAQPAAFPPGFGPVGRREPEAVAAVQPVGPQRRPATPWVLVVVIAAVLLMGLGLLALLWN